MDVIFKKSIKIDNGGRRWGGDRRIFSYTLHVPERRSGRERRAIVDRRKIYRIRIEQTRKNKIVYWVVQKNKTNRR